MKGRAGFGILECMIAMSILMFGLMGAGQMQINDLKAAKTLRLYITRQRLSYILSQVASMKGAIRVSTLPAVVALYPINTMLRDCVNGGTLPTCNSSVFFDFILFPPFASSGVAVPGAISGIPSAPLAYDYTGRACSSAVCPPDQYPLLVSTQFRPICRSAKNGDFPMLNDLAFSPGAQIAGGTCSWSDSIEVRLTITAHPSINLGIRPYRQSFFIENAYIEGA